MGIGREAQIFGRNIDPVGLSATEVGGDDHKDLTGSIGAPLAIAENGRIL